MRNYFLNKFHFVWPIGALLFMSGCSSQVRAPQIDQPSMTTVNAAKNNQAAITPNDQSKIDLEQEGEIEKLCLEAWRKCVAGDKEGSIKQLKDLAKQYPKSSSVLFMTGQVLERSGRKNEAIGYYEKSLHNSDFATMSLFKLAESLRTTGNTKKAIIRYRELIAVSPDFPQAYLGLAKSLRRLDPASQEAQEELIKVLQLDPNNKEALSLSKH